jgi:hypothetical protein
MAVEEINWDLAEPYDRRVRKSTWAQGATLNTSVFMPEETVEKIKEVAAKCDVAAGRWLEGAVRLWAVPSPGLPFQATKETFGSEH